VNPEISVGPGAAPARPVRQVAWTRVLRAEVVDELRGLLREPTVLMFSVAMPVGFFALFAGLYGGEVAPEGAFVGTTMLATLGAFGVLSVAGMSPGIGLADDRRTGWLRVKRAWAVPLPVTILGKVVAALPYTVGVLVAMTATSAAMGNLDIRAGTWLLLVTSLLVGALPFTLLGLSVGSLANANTSAAILNALLLPSAFASGLFIPLAQLPPIVADLAAFNPVYHLGQLGLGVIAGEGVVDHGMALLGFTAVTTVLAAVVYRRSVV
jgi:ABC-2 type transport system permease protein